MLCVKEVSPAESLRPKYQSGDMQNGFNNLGFFFGFFFPLFAFTASMDFTGLVIYNFSRGDQSLGVT